MRMGTSRGTLQNTRFRAAFTSENPINMRSESQAKRISPAMGTLFPGYQIQWLITPRNDVPMESLGPETRRTYANFCQRPAKSPKAVHVPTLREFEKNGVTIRFPAARLEGPTLAS